MCLVISVLELIFLNAKHDMFLIRNRNKLEIVITMRCRTCMLPLDAYDIEEGQCANCGRQIGVL